jgi:hypothetical protein
MKNFTTPGVLPSRISKPFAGIPSRREVLDESDSLSFRHPIVGSWGYSLVREIPDHFVWIQFLRKEYCGRSGKVRFLLVASAYPQYNDEARIRTFLWDNVLLRFLVR